MFNYKCTLPLVLFFAAICSCEPAPKLNEAAEKAKILELHNEQRKHHFEKMVNASVEILSDDFISVNRGEITRPTKAENIAKRERYFGAVNFEKWDDVEPPIIRFSNDYSMAYTIVHKEVIVNYPGENGEQIRDSTDFSWVAIYKKHPEGGWKIDCVASTNKPSGDLGSK